jgi:AcrR family transcriptional regulator
MTAARPGTIRAMPTARASARSDARRKQILDGAMAAIREQPIGDVQLAAIAAHAGMKASHVLYYFPSRDAVLIAAVARAERELAAGRSERLREIADPEERLTAYVTTYLPTDLHDPVWKLWFEGWLRSASREEFGEVGWQASVGWRTDLAEAVQHALGPGAWTGDQATVFARRFNYYLDGIAVHVLAGHVTPAEGAEMAMAALRSELRLEVPDRAE